VKALKGEKINSVVTYAIFQSKCAVCVIRTKDSGILVGEGVIAPFLH